MDVSTGLAQAYLHVNGHFTATDYPLVESARDQAPRTFTDIDMLAVRLHRYAGLKGYDRNDSSNVRGPVTSQTDPAPECPHDRTDMIVAEVKQGRAQVNPGSRNRHVLAAALVRFGCCSSEEAASLVHALLQHGRAQGKSEHIVHMVLFASSGARAPHGWHWIHLDHVFRFLNEYLRAEQSVLGPVDLHDPALAWLSLIHKCNLTLETVSPYS